VDGSGKPCFEGDIGVSGTEISAVGDLRNEKAKTTINAKGRLVCPGFIDVHSHSDLSYLADRRAISKISQGITTEIVGHCGFAAGAVLDKGKQFFNTKFEEAGISWNWNTVAEYLSRIESSGIPVNIGTMAGLSVIRASVMGFENREVKDKDLQAMKSLLEQAMLDGAFGLSTGLKYAPDCFTGSKELSELCSVVQNYGGIHSSHIRNQGNRLIESIQEVQRIGRETSVHSHIAHLKIKGCKDPNMVHTLLSYFDYSQENQFDLTFDQYPYLAASCGAMAFLPAWAREGYKNDRLKRLKNPKERRRIERELREQEDWGNASRIIISRCGIDPELEGKCIEEIAASRGTTKETVLCDLLCANEGVLPVVFFICRGSDIRTIAQHPAMMVSSDGMAVSPKGVLASGKPHPRSYGAFPRYLRQFVLDEKVIKLEDGIRRMTSYPAKRFGIRNRGLLLPSMKADIIIINEDTVRDQATYKNPHQLSDGIDRVIVNGSIVLSENQFTGAFPGRALRFSEGH
jgi:N-acyl-D-amino-acid deacylase